MREYQAVVRVRHRGWNLAEASDQLDAVTGELVDYGATAQMWDDVTEWTMTVRVPSLWDVGAVAGRAVRGAFEAAGWPVEVVRVDAWQVAEWEHAKGLTG
ncbi:hypothetical protein JHN55_22780 [Streptomyces sp. MBT56]|uniref:hypothetical protein n=1 Tax=unclassified Streptomyces TaxID=2593676 RepID=UPI00190E1873|nr:MULTISPECIES: hypothetical protein [unclassified Streptomyces]MBK3559297.1 hypothetical protein [Streptomyces sp. MBT56]MBK3601020.1 hypothetical protein [Streptomyces sp. MBT54]MBK3613926.1 hypothetical protein [Streptomyces sp. MBT98]MBK6042009.1 hypothetical protein [Streptomyces sp. MBT55]